jgi:geranylgeranyl pyrophosphate synthase
MTPVIILPISEPAESAPADRLATRVTKATETRATEASKEQMRSIHPAPQTDAKHGHSNSGSGEIFAPIREPLVLVEEKLRLTDSSLFAPLSDAFVSLIGSGGKRMRPALTLLAYGVGSAKSENGVVRNQADEKVLALAASVEMLHTSTLVHDDVIDGALLRRGAPTLNATWSGGSTVMAGNYMFGAAARFAAATGSMRVIHLFAETLRVIVDGELQQLLDRYNYDQPSESYLNRIYAKTASLFCAATEGGALLAGLDEAHIASLRSYGYNLGMAFQIVDDILDFVGDAETLGKPAGSDLNQGTLTLPFFAFLETVPDRNQFIRHLEETRDRADAGEIQLWRDLVAEVVSQLRATNAADVARVEAQRYLDIARADLADFPENEYKRALLLLCDFVTQRKH